MLTPKDLKDKRVLIVDDDDDFREAMALSFDRLGCEVMTASNGREAFDLTQRQPVDVVVSDIRMPNGDGVELMERLKANSATAPVLLLITGYAEVTVEEVLNKGAEALINKPFKPLTLQEAIARLLTPPEQRWEQHSDRVEVDLKIQLKVEGIEKAIEAKVVNFGRGGIFIAIPPEDCPSVDAETSFKINFENAIEFEGSGVVRWMRHRNTTDFPSGCGIEFTYLGEAERKWVAEFIRLKQMRPYIPNS